MVVYEWTDTMEKTLDIMRQNALKLSELSMEKYNALQKRIHYLQLPLAILSAVNAVAVVALDNYISENYVVIGCSATSATIAGYLSYDWFLSSQKKMEADLSFYKDCEAFSENIKTVLNTERMNRKMDGAKFLQDTFASYKKLVEGNSVIERFKGNVTLYKDSICEQVEDMETFVVDHWNILFRPTLRRFKKKNAELIESVKQAGQDVKSIVEPVTNEVVEKVEEGTGWFKGKLNGLWGKDEEKEEEENKEEAGISMETVYTTVKDIPTMLISKRDEPRKFAMSFVDKR
jgi:hypothetical protein